MKAVDTKQNILESGLKLVRKFGFEAISIGDLAKDVGMSKSGLFAHFKSKEALQIMLLDHAAQNFTLKVIKPALKVERGLPRLKALIKNLKSWSYESSDGNCPILGAVLEYDGRPGVVFDRVKMHIEQLIKSITRACDLCVEEGHFRENIDTHQVAFEIYSLILGAHVYHNTIGPTLASSLMNRSLNDLFERNK